MNDTPPEIVEMVFRMLMERLGEKRFMMGSRSFDAARAMVLASLPPGLSEMKRKRLLFQRFYGERPPF